MKVGILTFHSQTSYGGILQAVALQEAIRRMGHEVVVIDRWMTPRNGTLNGILVSGSLRGWVQFVVRAVLGFGDIKGLVRCLRSKRFVRKHLRLTNYSFYDWKEAPSDLGVDLIVVGSDQVWSRHFWDPDPYLLIGAPPVAAISYAASMGGHDIPKNKVAIFKDGLRHFSAISVRERELAALISPLTECAIEHVVDPTLLIGMSFWDSFKKVSGRRCVVTGRKRKLTLYLIHAEARDWIPQIEEFKGKLDCDVVIMTASPCRELPRAIGSFIRAVLFPYQLWLKHISYKPSLMPDEFISEISSSDWVITDSFHGLMFSVIYRKNVRILRPVSALCSNMAARLSEVAEDYIVGMPYVGTIAEALESFAKGKKVDFKEDKLAGRVRLSWEWLKNALQRRAEAL